MPSHTFNEVGRWGDSVRANLEAWHSDLKADIGEGFAIYPDHNLHMLLYAASMDGQGAIAMQAGKDYAKRTSDTMYQVLTLLRFGRFDEVLEVTKRPEREVPAAVWDFAQGYAHLRAGRDRLREGVSRARAEDRRHVEGRVPQPSGARRCSACRGHPRRRDLRADGDLPGAIAAFERAVVADDALDYDEPEPLPFPARHWLGAAARGRRAADAEASTARI